MGDSFIKIASSLILLPSSASWPAPPLSSPSSPLLLRDGREARARSYQRQRERPESDEASYVCLLFHRGSIFSLTSANIASRPAVARRVPAAGRWGAEVPQSATMSQTCYSSPERYRPALVVIIAANCPNWAVPATVPHLPHLLHLLSADEMPRGRKTRSVVVRKKLMSFMLDREERWTGVVLLWLMEERQERRGGGSKAGFLCPFAPTTPPALLSDAELMPKVAREAARNATRLREDFTHLLTVSVASRRQVTRGRSAGWRGGLGKVVGGQAARDAEVVG